MDYNEIKILLLEKIFNVFAPKIIGYYRIIQNYCDTQHNISWSPNFYYLEEHFRDTNHSFRLVVSDEEQKENYSITLTLIRNGNLRNNAARRLYMGQPENIIQEEEIHIFNNKKTAIKKILTY